MNLSAILFPKTGRPLAVASLVFFGVFAVVAILWTAQALYSGPRLRVLENALKASKASLIAAGREARSAPNKKTGTAPSSGYQVVEQFQGELVLATEGAGCTLVQFSGEPNSTAYVSHYGGGDSGGYNAYHVRLSLNGNLSRVMTALQRLNSGQIPFEFASVNLIPMGQAGSVQANNVNAVVEVDVLGKGAA